jgi:hypothetical protein
VDLGIVTVSYNTCQLTLDCLASVYAALAQEGLSAQVCVVDNASGDDSAAQIAARYPQATLIRSQENLGFAGGTNLGLARLLALDPAPRHILLLNPDTLVQPQALTRMVALLDARPEVGAVGAQLAYGDGSFQHGAFSFPTLWMALFDFWTINHRLINSRLNGRYPRRLYEAGEPFPIDHPLGAALMARREALQQVGLLDEGYFMYCEEIDWCLRAKRLGWGIYCVPQARIIHLEGQSTRQFRDRMFIALWRSRFRLFTKHYSAAYRAGVRLIVRAGLARQSCLVRRALANGELEPEAARRQLDAYRTVREM